MRSLDQVRLTESQRQALAELHRQLLGSFGAESVCLYGSVVRGEADNESDTDLLVITKRPLDRPARRRITDLVFEVNLRYGTNFSALVVDRAAWDKGPVSVLPLKEEILREGVTL
jgi:uncharacterized protein